MCTGCVNAMNVPKYFALRMLIRDVSLSGKSSQPAISLTTGILNVGFHFVSERPHNKGQTSYIVGILGDFRSAMHDGSTETTILLNLVVHIHMKKIINKN